MLTDDFYPGILRAYDIRGTWNTTLFVEDAWRLGGKLSTYVRDRYDPSITQLIAPDFEKTHKDDPKPFVLGIVRDGRESSPALFHALCTSLRVCGIHVIDFGVGPSPYAYYAAHHTPIDGAVMITASHNPKNDNGFKLLIYGESLSADGLHHLAQYPVPQSVHSAYAHPLQHFSGTLHNDHARLHDYGAHVVTPAMHIRLPKKIAWDFSNGAMARLKPWIEKHIHTEHIFLCDTLDADFPCHAPDPTVPENRVMIQQAMQKNACDVGFAFDGDGDRVVVLKANGDAIDGDRVVAILAKDVLQKHPGAVVLGDIKASAACVEAIQQAGGHPILTRTGHSFIKAKMKQEGALLAGEMSGHIFFADENKGYDDGLYAACRVLRLLSNTTDTLADLDEGFPRYSSTPEIKIPVDEDVKFKIIERIKKRLRNEQRSFNDLDGVRIDDVRGWWLVRASNTQASIVVRMEARLSKDLKDLHQECRAYLKHCDVYLPDVSF